MRSTRPEPVIADTDVWTALFADLSDEDKAMPALIDGASPLRGDLAWPSGLPTAVAHPAHRDNVHGDSAHRDGAHSVGERPCTRLRPTGRLPVGRDDAVLH